MSQRRQESCSAVAATHRAALCRAAVGLAAADRAEYSSSLVSLEARPWGSQVWQSQEARHVLSQARRQQGREARHVLGQARRQRSREAKQVLSQARRQ